MKRRMATLALAICALCAALAVVGCEEYEPESTEAEAVAYYQEKYGEKVGVEDAHGLGNYALFGYSYVGMEYVMDDGVSVIYIDDEGVFCDNRQTSEIEAAKSQTREHPVLPVHVQRRRGHKPADGERSAAQPTMMIYPRGKLSFDDSPRG